VGRVSSEASATRVAGYDHPSNAKKSCNAMRLAAALAIALTLSLAVGHCAGTLAFEKRFMLIGQVFPSECPVQGWLGKEPGFRYIMIPTDTDRLALTEDESRKFVRQYFPRTPDELFSNFHFVVMPDAHIKPLTDKQIFWLKEGYEQHGISSFVTVGADVTGNYEQEWMASPLHETLPTSLYGQMRLSGSFTIVILREDPPILSMFRPFNIESFVGSTPFSKNNPREGSIVWADAKFEPGSMRSPWLISWKLGTAGGHSWVASDDLDHQWWWPGGMRVESTNPYSGDVFLNIVYYSMGRALPTDIGVVHRLRESFGLYEISKQMVRGAIDWADKLGANVQAAEKALGKVEETHNLALTQYGSGEYEESAQTLEQAMKEADDALELAYRIKRQAMLYIYVVEWSVTTGTLLLSGSVLYALMIRRRLYRAVETTKLLRAEEG